MNILKHHTDQLVNMASTNALASEFIEDMPKSVAICNIAMGIASTTMTEEQMRALHNELEPVLERITEELKAVANKHGISFYGRGAALIGRAAFQSPEDRAEFEREVMPVLALKMLASEAQAISEGKDSFEA